jgi:hypothetical protein
VTDEPEAQDATELRIADQVFVVSATMVGVSLTLMDLGPSSPLS